MEKLLASSYVWLFMIISHIYIFLYLIGLILYIYLICLFTSVLLALNSVFSKIKMFQLVYLVIKQLLGNG